MHIEILTIFPELFNGFLSTSLISKACAANKVKITLTNIRDFAEPPHYKVDDEIYGGGPGMLLKPEPLAACIKAAKSKNPSARVIYLSPSGQLLKQTLATDISKLPALILICGRYEGIDQRVIDSLVDQEISIGDYILMGGEIPAMVLSECVIRLLDEVLGNQESLVDESFAAKPEGQLLEPPQYTRPAVFEGQSIPAELLSGNHKEILAWRKSQALNRTKQRRPDLIKEELK